MMVMHTMNETIYNLHNMKYVSEMLHDIGQRHRKFSDFKREFFLVGIQYLFFICYNFIKFHEHFISLATKACSQSVVSE